MSNALLFLFVACGGAMVAVPPSVNAHLAAKVGGIEAACGSFTAGAPSLAFLSPWVGNRRRRWRRRGRRGRRDGNGAAGENGETEALEGAPAEADMQSDEDDAEPASASAATAYSDAIEPNAPSEPVWSWSSDIPPVAAEAPQVAEEPTEEAEDVQSERRAAEPVVSLWDLAALQVIVEEAGGTFTDLSGRPTPDGGSAVATNGRLHAEVLDLLAPAKANRRN